MSTDAIIWDDSGGDTFCQKCGGCGCDDWRVSDDWIVTSRQNSNVDENMSDHPEFIER